MIHKVLEHRLSAKLLLVRPQLALVHGVIPPQVEDSTSLCWTSWGHEVPLGPFLQPVSCLCSEGHHQVHQSLFPLLGHLQTCRHALCPIVKVINEDIKWYDPNIDHKGLVSSLSLCCWSFEPRSSGCFQSTSLPNYAAHTGLDSNVI